MALLPEPSPSPWWSPRAHADRRPFLLARTRIKRALRRWFEDHDFLEVEGAALQVSPGNEAHLHAFATEAVSLTGERAGMYLHTSPEFACKKLLAAGERRIVDFARVFRNRERGPLHHPEFTLIEWYRAEEPYETLMDDCAALAETAGYRRISYRDRTCDPFAETARITVAEAFHRYAVLDLQANPERDDLAAAARAVGIRVAPDDTWADIFSRVLVEKVEPRLGIGRPTVLYEYPISEATLSRRWWRSASSSTSAAWSWPMRSAS